MKRIVLPATMAATALLLYQCANSAPEHSKYRTLFATALAQQIEQLNPLCAEPFGVTGFPYKAEADWRGWTTRPSAGSRPAIAPRPPPLDPLGFKWRDLVAAGLVYESEHLDPELNFDGYEYELSRRGQAIYSERKLRSGETQARFCLGKPSLKEIVAIGRPAFTVQGLSMPVRYVLRVEPVSPLLYDGTAKALGLHVPTRSVSGEVLYPEATMVMTLARDSGKVIDLEPR